MSEDIDRIESRSDIEEEDTYWYQHRLRGVITFLTEGDIVRVTDSSSQQTPEGLLKVTEDRLEMVEVVDKNDESYTLTGIHHPKNRMEGPTPWLRTSEGSSAGRVLELEVLVLTEEGDFLEEGEE